ncbi:MAG: hypothetical protein ACNA8W_06055 [Bradymonadaceae bacterium]
MLHEDLIYDEFIRRRDGEWQPEALELPLYIPTYEPRQEQEEDEESAPGKNGVIIIDMNEGCEIAV